jgi:AcrR family transcriptional regulator
LAATEAKRQSNRWPALLDSAAARFAEQGYHATTIRELAAATAMTPGAIYFHVANKQALLLAVYEEGVQRILERLEAAVAKQKEPWARLESAVEAHLESILDASAYARVVIRILPGDVPEIASDLTKLRDRYEARFRSLFSEIDWPRERDPKLARLFVLGAINWTPVWYRPSGQSIRSLARELLAPVRALSESKSAGAPQ